MNAYEEAVASGMPEDQAQALYPFDYQSYQQEQSEVPTEQPIEQPEEQPTYVMPEGQAEALGVAPESVLSEAQKEGLAKVATGEQGTVTEAQIQESLATPAFEGSPVTTPSLTTQIADVSQYYDPSTASVNDPASEAHAIELYLKLQNKQAVYDALVAEGVTGSVADNLAAHALGSVVGDTVNYLWFNPVTGKVEAKDWATVKQEAEYIAQIKEIAKEMPDVLSKATALTEAKIKVLFPLGYEDVSLQEAWRRLSPEDGQKAAELESQYIVLAMIYGQMNDWKNQADAWYGQTTQGFAQYNILYKQPENLVPFPTNYEQLESMIELVPYFNGTYNHLTGGELSINIVDAIEAGKQKELLAIGIPQDTIDNIDKSIVTYKKEQADFKQAQADYLAKNAILAGILKKLEPYKIERGRVVKLIFQDGIIMPEYIDPTTGKQITAKKWDSLTLEEQQQISRGLILAPSISYDLYKYFKDNGTGEDVIAVIREAGFDEKAINDFVKAVQLEKQITDPAIADINKMLNNERSYGAGEMSLDRAIKQSGYVTLQKYDYNSEGKIIGYSEYDYNTGKLIATYRWVGMNLIAVDPLLGDPTVSAKDVMLAKWNLMTPEEKEKAALLYASDPYNQSLFGEIYVEWENLVTEVSQKGVIPYLLAGFVGLVPTAMKPIAKTITDQPTTIQEWAMGGASIVLLGLPVGAPILSATFGKAGIIATSTLLAGAGGVFTKQTVDDWENMTPAQRAMAVGMDALLFVGAGLNIRGLTVDAKAKAAVDVASKATEPMGAEVSIPVKIGETISVVKTTIADIPNRVLSVPEAIKYYAEGLGLKAEQIALAIEKGFIEVTPEIAKKFADSVINAGDNLVNRVMATPEAIKYYTEGLGIEASKVAELAKKGLLEVTPEVAQKVADAINRGIDVIDRRVMTAPQAIEYYIGSLGLKVEQVAELAERGLLEVTPEIAQKIAREIEVVGGKLVDRVMSIPEAIQYYSQELGLKADQIAELGKKGLLEVTPKVADRIAEQIKLAINTIDTRIVTMPDAVSYYAKELQLKVGDIMELAQKKAVNAIDVTFEQARQIVERVKATGDKFASIPDAIEYYTGELGIKAGKVGEAIKATLTDIYEAMKNKDRETVIAKARELERLSAQIDDAKLGEQLKIRAQDLQRNVDDYLSMADRLSNEDKTKIGDAVEVTDKVARQSLDDLLAQTRLMEGRDIAQIIPEGEARGLLGEGTRAYKAGEIESRGKTFNDTMTELNKKPNWWLEGAKGEEPSLWRTEFTELSAQERLQKLVDTMPSWAKDRLNKYLSGSKAMREQGIRELYDYIELRYGKEHVELYLRGETELKLPRDYIETGTGGELRGLKKAFEVGKEVGIDAKQKLLLDSIGKDNIRLNELLIEQATEGRIDSFTTARGSVYKVIGEGTQRTMTPEIAKEQGLIGEDVRPQSIKTYYLTEKQMNKVGVATTVELSTYIDKNGNLILRGKAPVSGTIVEINIGKTATKPAVGLYPLEKGVGWSHFGDKIISVETIGTIPKLLPTEEIRQIIERININMDELARLRGQSDVAVSFSDTMKAKLKELGYTDEEIAFMSDLEKLDRVANEIKPEGGVPVEIPEEKPPSGEVVVV